MIIRDNGKAEEVLLDIGYYRLGYYSFPFEITYPKKLHRTHYYRAWTYFDDVVNLYYFDKDLRGIIFDYVNRIEINLRTKIIYYGSNLYTKDPIWYMNKGYVNSSFVKNLNKKYPDLSSNNESLNNHHKNHPSDRYAPAWKTIEYLTFGEVINLYKGLRDATLKSQISLHFNVTNINIFENYLDTMRLLRNTCAHGHNVFDLTLNKSLRAGPLKNICGHYNDLVGCLLVAHYLLSSISVNRASEFKSRIKELIEKPKNKNLRDITGYIEHFYK